MTHQTCILVGSSLVRIDVTFQIPNEYLANNFLFPLASPQGHQCSIQHVGKTYHKKYSTLPFDK